MIHLCDTWRVDCDDSYQEVSFDNTILTWYSGMNGLALCCICGCIVPLQRRIALNTHDYCVFGWEMIQENWVHRVYWKKLIQWVQVCAIHPSKLCGKFWTTRFWNFGSSMIFPFPPSVPLCAMWIRNSNWLAPGGVDCFTRVLNTEMGMGGTGPNDQLCKMAGSV